jgi:hypothetical protein
MKFWNLVFYAQGSKVIIVAIWVGEVKTYVIVVEAFKEKERHDTTKIGGKTSLVLNYFA